MLGGLGLFGLTAFMAKRRTREIGIRRVMGASTPVLIKILSTDFLKLVLIANIIGWPISWYFMDKWLEQLCLQGYHITVDIRWYRCCRFADRISLCVVPFRESLEE